jgi:hypothetical protein
MSELAYNINGEGFEPPETATGWRVRRMKQRGAPEVVYGKEGLPLIIPIEADLAELRRHVDAAGRFRLDPVDDRGRNVEGAQPAYVVVPHKVDEDGEAIAPVVVARSAQDTVVAEAMRLNTELAKSVIDRFPEMMTAAAELLRAADGAGIPARLPRAVEPEEDEEDDDAVPQPPSSPGFEMINTLIAQVVPIVINGLMSKKMNLASVVDWRRAHATGAQEKQAASVPALEIATETPATEAAAPAQPLPPIDAKTMMHFVAIQSALKPDEAALAKQLAAELSPAEMRAWFDELSKLDVPQAVQKIRVLLAGNTEAVS